MTATAATTRYPHFFHEESMLVPCEILRVAQDDIDDCHSEPQVKNLCWYHVRSFALLRMTLTIVILNRR